MDEALKMKRLAGACIASIVGLALLAGAPAVRADTVSFTWSFSGNVDCGSTTSGTTSHACYTQAGNTRTSNPGGGAPVGTAKAYSNTGSGGVLETAYLGLYSGGLGVKNRDGVNGAGDSSEWISPEHSTDNNQRYDSVLLKATSDGMATKVELTGVKIGYRDQDSDITVLAYVGTGTPASLEGLTYSQLTNAANDWQLVGHYSDLTTTSTQTINAAGIESAYWLVMAYNPTWSSKGWTEGNDHVKLMAFYGKQHTGVPEPSMLILGGLALGSAAFFSRRKRRA
jgi:hypothetical protein